MASLSVRRLDDEVVRRLKIRAARDAVSLEETVRRILGTAVVDEEPAGTMFRRIVGCESHAPKGVPIALPDRWDWSSCFTN